MQTRRGFMSGLAAVGLAPTASWADAGSPAFLNAGQLPNGSHAIFGLSARGDELFQIELPGRGHAAAAHPYRPQAVGFARRPGNFAMVFDCATGRLSRRISAPAGRHFYGHGAYSADGARLYTSENDFDAARGVIGVWDTVEGYTRLGEFASGGVGPHDLRLMPDGDGLVVANGGIETHPDSGRAKLNIPLMQPNLSYLGLEGSLLEQVELSPALHRNSIRHLDLRSDGLVAIAMQWQGPEGEYPPLLALHKRGGPSKLLMAEGSEHRRLSNYAGSVAFDESGGRVAITSPRGGVVQLFEMESGEAQNIDIADVCGVSRGSSGFVFTSGKGAIGYLQNRAITWMQRRDVKWDNHLVRIG